MNELRWPCMACILAATVLLAPALAADSKPNQEFAQKASWKIPTAESVHQQAQEWLGNRKFPSEVREQLETMWTAAVADGKPERVFDVLCATLAASPSARELLKVCTQPRREISLPDVGWLNDENVSPLERNNLRLAYGRWLVQESLYDEAAEQLKGLKAEDVADPAGLLFYQAVVYHRTLDREPGLAAIGRLLENAPLIPGRYASVARLMQADLEGLKDESLDHIARRMDDIRRRLDLGRAGPKVRAVEDGVIASLDKLIEEIEKQQQAAAAAAAAAARRGGTRSIKPAQDSVPIQGRGEGEVTKKLIGKESGWGNLPPHERQEALQQIGKDFPAHYRDVIEQYFRKLASESGEKPDK